MSIEKIPKPDPYKSAFCSNTIDETTLFHIPEIVTEELKSMDRVALTLSIIGALNWGSVGIFRYDVIAGIFGGQGATVSRILYTLIALAGLWCVSLLFRERRTVEEL